ncbi:hypothetical protein F4212_13805 [Candidatus Poribacteria bacterium]|nr:hypothetical protein [Candidatus Poribacteria bacterium]
MTSIVDIGKRIELVPIDPHFKDITIALYRQELDSRAVFKVHTYSRIEGSPKRIQEVINIMQTLGGMQKTSDGLLFFPCGDRHEAACRRVFLEACKLTSDTPVEPRPLNILDKKSKLTISVDSLGSGTYRVKSNGEGRSAERRVSAIAAGLIKLGEMEYAEDNSTDSIRFTCGQSHDALVGLLLVRAPNVRVILREQEAGTARGVLSAPSQQT